MRLLQLLPWTRHARAMRSYRRSVAYLDDWRANERKRMAEYDAAVARIVADDGGRSWR